MIITETILINDKEFIHTYSSSGLMIERDGIRYAEATDPVGYNRTYIETDEVIEVEATEQDYIDALGKVGVDV